MLAAAERDGCASHGIFRSLRRKKSPRRSHKTPRRDLYGSVTETLQSLFQAPSKARPNITLLCAPRASGVHRIMHEQFTAWLGLRLPAFLKGCIGGKVDPKVQNKKRFSMREVLAPFVYCISV